ncbi:cell envelope integrity protein CreD [Cellvibrio zantedeschiae]|uniref:Cell envelope integrity protein CreD n=1 Tax=Cellvibrio zantedeschiae TaxID=1237077 RepID=A0ABQ3AQ23_9GAMM|nr:cell envelope integrity protein CreD [Cellvibrio zantedeschiae]GGY64214.1 cell envelope integrity protein CreD [Cellvibrio zantedeschiae]
MKRPLLLKFITIGCLMLLLMIPVGMINGVIKERKSSQQEVIEEIAKSASYSQKLIGPVLVVPYIKHHKEWKTDEVTKVRYQVDVTESGERYFLPSAFSVDGKVKTERRARGIYEARLYHADNMITGHFDVPDNYGVVENLDVYEFDSPYISMGIKDIRGIENALKIKVGEDIIDMQPGTKLKILGEGVHATIKHPDQLKKAILHFSFNLVLQGTESLSIVPIGRESNVDLSSDWPHPSFMGDYLPTKREIDDKGFIASWRTSYFSSNQGENFERCINSADCEAFNNRYFGVSFIDPVDQYVKSDRAIKYAILFIALTFAGFFLFEILKRLAIHPMQYGLVGLSLAFFYLLLVSLSEHIAFDLAYLIASSACIALIGFYVSYVLKSILRSAIFSSLLASLYGLLYSLLSAEDYALLMGSTLLFALLGVFMVLTRKLDWYSVGRTEAVN